MKTREDELKELIKEHEQKAHSNKEEDLCHSTYEHFLTIEKAELKGIAEGRKLQKIDDDVLINAHQEEDWKNGYDTGNKQGYAKALADCKLALAKDRKIREFHNFLCWLDNQIELKQSLQELEK